MEIQIEGNRIYAPLKEKWLHVKPEEKVRQKYICRLVNNYNFSVDQMEQELQVNNSQRGQGAARADIVVWKSKQDKQEKKSPLIRGMSQTNLLEAFNREFPDIELSAKDILEKIEWLIDNEFVILK